MLRDLESDLSISLGAGAALTEWHCADWIKDPRVAAVRRDDGSRPVIFKLERADIESRPDGLPTP